VSLCISTSATLDVVCFYRPATRADRFDIAQRLEFFDFYYSFFVLSRFAVVIIAAAFDLVLDVHGVQRQDQSQRSQRVRSARRRTTACERSTRRHISLPLLVPTAPFFRLCCSGRLGLVCCCVSCCRRSPSLSLSLSLPRRKRKQLAKILIASRPKPLCCESNGPFCRRPPTAKLLMPARISLMPARILLMPARILLMPARFFSNAGALL